MAGVLLWIKMSLLSIWIIDLELLVFCMVLMTNIEEILVSGKDLRTETVDFWSEDLFIPDFKDQQMAIEEIKILSLYNFPSEGVGFILTVRLSKTYWREEDIIKGRFAYETGLRP